MAIDLDAMDRNALMALKSDVEKALKTLDARRKSDARKAAEKAVREFGFTMDELMGGEGSASKGSKGVAKYANPENPEQTWTGRGRKPTWVLSWIESGKDVEALAI